MIVRKGIRFIDSQCVSCGEVAQLSQQTRNKEKQLKLPKTVLDVRSSIVRTNRFTRSSLFATCIWETRNTDHNTTMWYVNDCFRFVKHNTHSLKNDKML